MEILIKSLFVLLFLALVIFLAYAIKTEPRSKYDAIEDKLIRVIMWVMFLEAIAGEIMSLVDLFFY